MSKLTDKPLTKFSAHSFRRIGPKQPDKQDFMGFFPFGAIWAPPYEPEKVPKGTQVGGMYGPMSKLNNKPLIKLSGPFF
jgi:hypothetical protein